MDAHSFNLTGPPLVRMIVGDGMIRMSDTFEFAKKAPATIFIDQLGALDTKWFNP